MIKKILVVFFICCCYNSAYAQYPITQYAVVPIVSVIPIVHITPVVTTIPASSVTAQPYPMGMIPVSQYIYYPYYYQPTYIVQERWGLFGYHRTIRSF